jgi:glyoxylase-like metal-dependent hydrolase (beta-lactamase superfamily II)
MRFGDLELFLLSDGIVRVDAGGPFGLVPRLLYENYLTPDPNNTVPMNLNCLLIRTDGKTILVDTGLGEKLTFNDQKRWTLERPQGGLEAALRRQGPSPKDVDIVINTHLHADHCGGNTQRNGDDVVAAFPRAEYWVQRIEWAEASHPDARTEGTYHPDNFTPLMAEGRLRLLHGDTEVSQHVHCVVTPGHTRGHQSIQLTSGDWHGLYLGDLATYAIHFERTSWLTSYDVHPLENVITKQRWQSWASTHSAWLFFEHDPLTPIARLRLHDGRYEIEPVSDI